MKVSVFCPGHITGYFLPFYSDDPDVSGSCGAGMVIDRGVTITVSPADTYSFFGIQHHPDRDVSFSFDSSDIIRDLVERLGIPVSVLSVTDLPLQSGYGLSAAALLATAHGINMRFQLGLSDEDCARYAHRVEIDHKTGLGDVAACMGGGLVCRKKPGIHSDSIRIRDTGEIAVLTLGPIPTTEILENKIGLRQLKRAFPTSCPGTCQEFFRFSRQFALKSGFLTDRLKDIIQACTREGIESSMTMLGEGVFAYGERAAALLSRFGDTEVMHISETGPVIMNNGVKTT
ncbi:MAG: GHMP kinase [Methanospirillaceae archaeon]|nr:GHMP kinase [Methanospirillaceae archaeon]